MNSLGRAVKVLLTGVVVALLALLVSGPVVQAQTTAPEFDISALDGAGNKQHTSLQFGPDGRLYTSVKGGEIFVYTIQRNNSLDYEVIDSEQIDLVNDFVPNHDDDGTPNSTKNRQVTGIYVTGTAANPVLYVSSSDWRIGAGGGGNDKDLDTNSGVISRLTWTGTEWEKVDLVRGLPRSEENHASNGMAFDESANILYLAQGGHTNAGAPSNNFAFTTEYAYSAAILSIDLTAIEAMPIQTDTDLYSDDNYTYQWIYDLPTLDDPTRANEPDGSDPGDPFGGNDGLNQAKIDPGSPVQIHSPGYRNLYDVIITENGRMYAIDNGANGNWGGHPAGEADYPTDPDPDDTPGECTNEYLSGEPGSTSPGPGGDPKVNNKNGLHYVRELVPGDENFVQAGEPYYAGHPAPIRGNPDGAGIYIKGVNFGSGDVDEWLQPGDPRLPVDWPPVPASMAYAAECDFRNSGETDGALANFGPSTNGLTEYTASNFGGALQGDILAAGYSSNGQQIFRVQLSADGKTATNCPTNTATNCNAQLFNNFAPSGAPLDIIAQGDDDPFPGNVFVAMFGGPIMVAEPGDTIPGCTAADDDTIDEDGDGYTNADELDNGSNPCVSSSQPDDFDGTIDFNGFKRSDLNDPDDDNDGINDVDDPFAIDADNGLTTGLPVTYNFFPESAGFGFFDIGLTGLMYNGSTDYLDQYNDPATEDDGVIAGGTSGLLTIPAVDDGDAYEDSNDQRHAFQFGVDVDNSTPPFTVEAQMNGPFNQIDGNFEAQGIYIGDGSQSSYLKFTMTYNSGLKLQVGVEDNDDADFDTVSSLPGFTMTDVFSSDAVDLFLVVDPGAGTVQPQIAFDDSGGPINVGSPISIPADWLDGADNQGLAVGIIATSFGGGGDPFGATWDEINVTENPSTAQALVTVNTGGINGSTFGNSSFVIDNISTGGEEITNVTFDLSTTMLPDIVFDPNGGAGDGTSRSFTPESDDIPTGTGSFDNAHQGGFYELSVDFTGFTPGAGVYDFGVDIDPTSIKGGSAPGPNESGSVSGLELSGATVSVTFDNGETQTIELFRTPNDNSDSQNTARSQIPAAPSIDVLNVNTPASVFSDQQTVRVSGTPGADVRLLVLEAGLFVEDLTGPYAGVGFDIDPFEANSVIRIEEFSGTIDGDGFIDFNITLQDNDPEAGLHYIAAVVDDGDATSDLSNVEVVEYDPDAAPDFELRINAGGNDYTDGDGNLWLADKNNSDPSYAANGSVYAPGGVNGDPVANTDDDELYWSERYGGQGSTDLQYDIPVPAAGEYIINLYFAEIYHGVAGGSPTPDTGLRVFDIFIEGNSVETDLDILAETGNTPLSAISRTYIVNSDTNLDLDFNASVDNAKISAIEILGFTDGDGETAIELDPISDRTDFEGDSPDLAVVADGGDGNLQYSISGQPAGMDIEPTNGQIFGTIQTGAAGVYNVTVTVDDSDGSSDDAVSTTFEWTVLEPITGGTVLYRVNNGGPELADSPIPWAEDQAADAANGTANLGTPSQYLVLNENTNDQTFGANFTGTNSLGVPDALFGTERYSTVANPNNMQWEFPVQAGEDYIVNLYFAEVWTGAQDPGVRVFDVEIEDVPVLEGFDITAAFGWNTAGVESIPVTAGDNLLDIDFIKDTQNPKISAIEIIAADDGGGNTAPTIDPIADQSVTEGDTVNLMITADDADAGETPSLSIDVVDDSTSTSIPTSEYTFQDNNNGTASFSWVTEPGDAGSYTATVTADDGTDQTTESFAITVNEAVAEQLVLCINAGGTAYTALDGTEFLADQYFTDGKTFSKSNAIANTDDDTLYQTERYGGKNTNNPPFSYAIPVDNTASTYTVELHFAEIFATAAGERVFNVDLEGTTVLTDYDIWATADTANGGNGGINYAVIETFTGIQPGDSTIDLSFYLGTNGVDNAKVSAICVIEEVDTTDTPPTVDPIADVSVEEGETAAATVTTTEADGDDVTLTIEVTDDSDDSVVPSGEYTFDDNGDGTGGFSWITEPGDAGSYTATVTATDKDGSDTETFAITVTEPTVSGEVLFRINVGGPQLAAADGSSPDWAVDNNTTPSPFRVAGSNGIYTGNAGSAHTGSIDTTDPSIPPSAPDAMFNTERYDTGSAPEMLWQFPITGGTEVEVRLYFAELFGDITAAEQRVFDVSVEGSVPPEYNDIDPFAVAGAKGAFMLSTQATVSPDGTLDIEFIHDVENPAVKGIEILVAGEPVDTPPTVDPIADITVEEGETAAATITTTEADGDDVTLTIEVTDDSDDSVVDESLYTFEDNGDGTGSFSWLTELGDAGSYTATVTATDKDGSDTETFAITVTEPVVAVPEAYVAIDPGSGITSSTFNGGFIVTNNSTEGLTITEVSFDLSTAMYPNMVFDPNGSAGDAAGQCFEPISGGTATGLIAPSDPCVDPFSGPRGNGGWDVATVSFNDFNPGETVEFKVDVDPTSIENATGTGSSGSVSGLELTGATVTVTFDDGTTLTGQTYRIQPSSNGGSENTLTGDPISAAPGLDIPALTPTTSPDGFQDATITDLNQTVQISGPAGADVTLLAVESDLLVGTPTGDPFEANEAQAILEIDATIGAGGTVDIPVTLPDDASGELYYLTAVIVEPDGRTSDIAEVWRLLVTEADTPPTVDPIADITVEEGETAAATITTTEADGDDVTLTIEVTDDSDDSVVDESLYTFEDNGDGTGSLSWTPSTAGSYTATVTATDKDGSNTETFSITVTPPPVPEAYVAIDPGGTLEGASTFNGGFIVTNNSTEGLTITEVSFDLSTAMYPNMVFDPNGSAGDAAGQCFEPISGGTATGLIAPSDPCVDPFSGPRGNGGWDVATVSFNDFNPGETVEFKVDVDPTSIENATSTGSSGAVSGLELTGATVTVTFDDGTTLSGQTFHIDGSNGGSENTLTGDPISAAPGLDIPALTPTTSPDGFQDATITDLNQTVQISGPAGADVSLLVLESDLLVGAPTGDPFEANQAQAILEIDATIGAGGTVDIPVTLPDDASGELYYLTAVIVEPDGRTSDIAQVWRLLVTDPTYTLTTSVVGSGSITVDPDQAEYLSGDTVELTATPDAGWQFIGWTVNGADSGDTNPLEVTFADENVDVTAVFNAIDNPPTADAGSDVTEFDADASGDEEVTLDGSGSTDDNGIVSYSWTIGETEVGTSDMLTYDFPVGTTEVTLTVTDNAGQSDTDTVQVTVEANDPPTADAGTDVSVEDTDDNGTEEVTLDGSGSSDPDDGIASYSWAIGGVEEGTGDTFTYDFPVGTTEVTLTVTDNAGQSDTDTVQVTVEAAPPTGPAVTQFILVNADTDTDIGPLSDGNTINLYDIGTNNLNIRAEVDPENEVESVLFELDGSSFRIENVPVYAFNGNSGSNYYSWVPDANTTYTVKATPYSADSAGGDAGQSLEVTFNVIDDDGSTGNLPPNADAGGDLLLTDSDEDGFEGATLDGSGSTDLDDGIASYSWTIGGVEESTTDSLTYNFPVGTTVVTLTVTDNSGDTDTDTATVTVQEPTSTDDPAITDLLLINAADDVVIGPIEDGDTINLADIGTNLLNIEALVNSETVEVVFDLTGPDTVSRTDGWAPYTLAWATQTDYGALYANVGTYNLTVTPFDTAGNAGPAETITVNIIDDAGGGDPGDGPQVNSLQLINAVSDTVYAPLEDGDTVDLADVGTNQINIEALVNGETTAVDFDLDGPDAVTRSDTWAPFTLRWASTGNYGALWIDPGEYTLTVTPSGGGQTGTPTVINFTVVDSDNLLTNSTSFTEAATGWQGTLNIDDDRAYPARGLMVFEPDGRPAFARQAFALDGSAGDSFALSYALAARQLADGGRVGVLVEFFADGERVDRATCLLDGRGSFRWEHAECSFTADADFDFIRVSFGAVGITDGQVAFDDLRLIAE